MVNFALMFLRRQWWLIGLGLILGVLLAPLAFVYAPPSYQATASIMLNNGRLQISPSPNMIGEAPLDNAAALESQVEILRSERIARLVMDNLHLRDDPEFAVSDQTRTARWLGPEIAELLGRSPIRTPERRERYQLDVFQSKVQVRRISGTFAIEIIASSQSSQKAAAIANAVAKAYLADQVDAKQGLSKTTGEWLGTRLAEVRTQLDEAKRAAIAFNFSSGLGSTSNGQGADRQLIELGGRLAEARGKAREAQVRLSRAEEAIATYASATVKPVLPDMMTNPLVSKLREQYFELSNREADWSQRFGRDHLATQKVRKQIAEVHVALLEEYRRVAESYRSELEIARQNEQAIERAMTTASDTHRIDEQSRVKLRELESPVQAYQAMYDSLLLRASETSEQGHFPIPRATLMNEALEPLAKSLKKTLLVFAALFGAGLSIGLGGAVLRDALNGTFLRLSDVSDVFGNRPVTIVPRTLGLARRRSYLKAVKGGKQPTSVRAITFDGGPHWFAETSPGSLFAGAMRTIKRQIEQSADATRPITIGVLSAEPNEGSTTVSAGLAISAAQAGSRVLLIDGDTRNPQLSRKLAPSAKVGLLEALNQSQPLEELIWKDEKTGLNFLPSTVKPATNLDEVIASEAMRRFLSTLSGAYDFVIIDFPPALPMFGVGLTTGMISKYVAVVKWGRSPKEATRIAYNQVPQLQDRIDTVVLNQVDTRKLKLFDATAARWFDEKRMRNYQN